MLTTYEIESMDDALQCTILDQQLELEMRIAKSEAQHNNHVADFAWQASFDFSWKQLEIFESNLN